MDAVDGGNGSVGGFLVVEVVVDEGVFGVGGREFLFFVGVAGGLLADTAKEGGADSPGGLGMRGFEVGRKGWVLVEGGNGHGLSPGLKKLKNSG